MKRILSGVVGLLVLTGAFAQAAVIFSDDFTDTSKWIISGSAPHSWTTTVIAGGGWNGANALHAVDNTSASNDYLYNTAASVTTTPYSPGDYSIEISYDFKLALTTTTGFNLVFNNAYSPVLTLQQAQHNIGAGNVNWDHHIQVSNSANGLAGPILDDNNWYHVTISLASGIVGSPVTITFYDLTNSVDAGVYNTAVNWSSQPSFSGVFLLAGNPWDVGPTADVLLSNFQVQTVVPEPSTLAAGIFGGLLLLGKRRFGRKTA